MRPWTAYQDDFLRMWWGRVWTKKLADLMDRDAREVSIRAFELGIAGRRPNGYVSPDEEATIRRLAAEGYSITAIGERIGINRHFVSDAMRRLGIRVNRHGPHFHDHHRAMQSKQRSTLGITNPAELRALAYRRFARERGWPEDLSPRQVQILDALYDHGPMGRRQMCELIGMRWIGRKSMSGARLPGNSYLADLLLRGVVFAIKKGFRISGEPLSDLYFIGPEIKRGDPTTWPPQESEDIRRSRSRRSTSLNSRKKSPGRPKLAR